MNILYLNRNFLIKKLKNEYIFIFNNFKLNYNK